MSVWRRKSAGVASIAAGAVLLVAGLVDHVLAAPKAALCQSGLGQVAQGLDGTVARDCGLVTAAESAVGWLLAAGVLTAVLGAAVLRNVLVTRSATPAPPPPPPADRPWWTKP